MTTVDVAYEEHSPSSSACGPGEGDFDSRVRACLVALGSTSPEQDMLKGTAMLMNAKNAGLEPSVAAATLYVTLHHAHPNRVELAGGMGASEEPPDAGPIDYTRIQSMARYYAKQQSLGEYIPNSAVPISAGWWAFYTTVPGGAPQRREVSHDELSREWMLQTHAGVRRRPQPGQLREEVAPTRMKLGIAGEDPHRELAVKLHTEHQAQAVENDLRKFGLEVSRHKDIVVAHAHGEKKEFARKLLAIVIKAQNATAQIGSVEHDTFLFSTHAAEAKEDYDTAFGAGWNDAQMKRPNNVDQFSNPADRSAYLQGYSTGRSPFDLEGKRSAPEWMTHVVYKSKLEGPRGKRHVKRDEKLESLITAIVGVEPAEVIPGGRDKSITLVYAAPDEATAKLKAEQVGLHVRGVKARYGRWEGVVRAAGRPMANETSGRTEADLISAGIEGEREYTVAQALKALPATDREIGANMARQLVENNYAYRQGDRLYLTDEGRRLKTQYELAYQGVRLPPIIVRRGEEEKLTYSQRKNLPRSAFALPETRDLPLTDAKGKLDPGHIHAAASRLSEMKHLGHLTKAQYEEGHARIQRAGKKVGIHVNEAAEDCGCAHESSGTLSSQGWWNVFKPASQPLAAKVVGHVHAKNGIEADKEARRRFGSDVFVDHTGGRGYRYALGTRLITPPRDRDIIDDIGAAAQESKLEWYNVYSPQSDVLRARVVGHVQATWIVEADKKAKAEFGPDAFARHSGGPGGDRYAIGTSFTAKPDEIRLEGQLAPVYKIRFQPGDLSPVVFVAIEMAGVRRGAVSVDPDHPGQTISFTPEQLKRFLDTMREHVRATAGQQGYEELHADLQGVLDRTMAQVNRGANEEPAEAPPIVINKTMVVAEEPVDFSGINAIPSLDRQLRWHRESDGSSYFAQSSLGRFTLKKRTPDRRHNVNPWLLELDGKEIKSRFASGFDTKDEAQAYATIYVEMRPHLQVNEDNAPIFEQCVPWVKVTRDPDKYRACLAMAQKAGPCDSPRKVYDLLHKHLMTEDQEIWIVVMTDLRDQIRGVVEVGRGQRDRVSVSAVDTLRPVLITGARNFYVVHNHPSGNAEPSRSDKGLTKGIKEVAAPFGDELNFKGHVVIGNGQYVEVGEGKKHYVK